MGTYTAFSDLAVKLLDKFGAPATLRRITRAYDPATGKTTDTSSDIDVRAVLRPVETTSLGGEVRTRTEATLAAKTTAQAPKVDDLLVLGTVTHRVTGIMTSAPIGDAITYRLILGAV